MKKRSLLKVFGTTSALVITASVTLLAFVQPPQSRKAASREEFTPGEIVVRFKEASSSGLAQGVRTASVNTLTHVPASVLNLHRRHGLKQIKGFLSVSSPNLGAANNSKAFEIRKAFERTYILDFDSHSDIHQIVKAYQNDPAVELAELNYTVYAFSIPNDHYYSSSNSWGQGYQDLWGLHKIHSDQAWDISTGTGVVVAVIDTGVDYTHPDIQANMWTNPAGGGHGYNFLTGTADPMDDHGHGTHVSGTIAATGNNNLGVIGVAYRAQIMALKFIGASGGGSDVNGANAIIWAADHGAQVINMSWGGAGSSTVLENAITYAAANGVVLVAAAGNDGSDIGVFPTYPADYPA